MRNLIVTLTAFILFSCSDKEDPGLQPQEFPEFVDSFVSHQNNQRRYILHIPDSYDGTKETPLVVFLHGGSGNSATAQSFTNFNQVSKDNGFLVAYPQGFFEASANSFVWADGRGLAPDNLGIDDVGFIDKLVTTLKEQYNVNEKRIYLCGFSNGSFLTQRIAFEKNGQFAAFGTLGGTMNKSLFDTKNPGRPIPMMYVFGSTDPLVPYNGGTVAGSTTTLPVVGIEVAVSYWVTNNNCQTTIPRVDLPNKNTVDNSTVTVFEYTNGACNTKVKFYKINGGGHTWPGVKLPNQTTLGETNLDIFASQELWDFFKQFELCK